MRVASRPPFSSSLWRCVDAAAQPQNILDLAAAVTRVTTSLSSSHVLDCRGLGASCRIVVKRIPAHPLPRGSRPPQRYGYPSDCQLDSRLKLLLPRRSSMDSASLLGSSLNLDNRGPGSSVPLTTGSCRLAASQLSRRGSPGGGAVLLFSPGVRRPPVWRAGRLLASTWCVVGLGFVAE